MSGDEVPGMKLLAKTASHEGHTYHAPGRYQLGMKTYLHHSFRLLGELW